MQCCSPSSAFWSEDLRTLSHFTTKAPQHILNYCRCSAALFTPHTVLTLRKWAQTLTPEQASAGSNVHHSICTKVTKMCRFPVYLQCFIFSVSLTKITQECVQCRGANMTVEPRVSSGNVCVFSELVCQLMHWGLPSSLYSSAARPLWSQFISPCAAANVNRHSPPPRLSCIGHLHWVHEHTHTHTHTGTSADTHEWRRKELHTAILNVDRYQDVDSHTHIHTGVCGVSTMILTQQDCHLSLPTSRTLPLGYNARYHHTGVPNTP